VRSQSSREIARDDAMKRSLPITAAKSWSMSESVLLSVTSRIAQTKLTSPGLMTEKSQMFPRRRSKHWTSPRRSAMYSDSSRAFTGTGPRLT
jgi:hypothetical protein